MDADFPQIDWHDAEGFGKKVPPGRVIKWIRESLLVSEDEAGQELLEIAHLFVVMGWMERRLFSVHLARYDLTIPQFFTIMAIYESEEGSTMGMLAGNTHQCSASMTGIVDRLLKLGFVERSRAEHDRRQVLVQLTEKGENVVQDVLRRRFESLKALISEVDSDAQRHFMHQLARMLRSAIALMRSELGEDVSSKDIESTEQSVTISCS